VSPPRPQPDRVVAPTVARVRLRYAKRGRMRFSSHRDFQRALERAIRRAGVPIAFSAGFSPHPRISYVNSAPTGVASEAEYLELGLTREVDVEQVCRALDDVMPDGFRVLEVVHARTPDLAERMQASVWQMVLAVDPERAHSACEQLLAADYVEVERLTKGGLRRFDARGALLHIACLGDGSQHTPPGEPDGNGHAPAAATHGATLIDGPCAILQAVVRHDTPAVRPDDVLAALRHVSGLEPQVPAMVTRLAQGPLVADARELLGALSDPLAPDRVG
jgi:radical SAM-linked protein